ncbi:possible organic solvent tolerance protein [Aurantimonas manganoxydans SI85-9A1]|uniref:LPS-assembly protein LptD n=3 Tax=Aurantimonas manganoxydans TaxID=651183 RepID=Q1YID9_AURMS|nr:possible organic solvent tolerance protein [Aurantimonas manganoxydans SI85-9A1]BAT29406.1 possible organic solvent tolerance protein [Aurantimonas manganoxydans SI85-9A1]
MVARGASRAERRDAQASIRAVLLAGTAICGLGFGGQAAWAQAVIPADMSVPDDAQMFLEADTVTYNTDNSIVTASGGVRIDYGSYKLVARNVTYDQNTRRLVASGDVELQQPDGNKVYADSIDITDDFRDGFVKALRIETPDNTRFAARDAVRQDGSVTTFQQGVYTACEACRENPDRAPLWQVKARRIVWDQTEKEVRYYGAKFELLGVPIAYMPYFQSPDPTVKRKTGFLTPTFKSSSNLGYGLRTPYFIDIADDKDVTLSGTYYTKQGFLAEAEYRQAFENGFFTLQAAGISQNDPDAFAGDNVYNTTTGELIRASPDFDNTERGMIGSKAQFALSERWTLGWDVMVQSDENFSATYEIPGYGDTVKTSEIYLTGLGDQSYFDLRGQKFQYQSVNPNAADTQPLVAPSFDYERIEQEGVLGGEVKLEMNVASLHRDDGSVNPICATSLYLVNDMYEACRAPFAGQSQYRTDLLRYNALEGDYTRVSTDLAWRDAYTLQSGLVLTPMASARGDFYAADMYSSGFNNTFGPQGALSLDDTGTRGMATAAMEARYPYLIETANSSHVIEPIGQVILRPDEQKIGLLPNEDAQTLVFNTANLFALDKFSGYDRIEGGSRANVGVKYAGNFDGGYSVNAVFGQSYHLGGVNSFAQTDLALVGYDSGLESGRSDYVGSIAVGTPIGVTLGTQARFDEESFAVRRTDVFGTYGSSDATATVTYTNIDAQPIYGSIEDRSQITGSGTLKFAENWSAFGSVGYDIKNQSVVEKTFGIGYADECFSLLVSYQDTVNRYSQESDSSRLMFTIGLRTISDFGYSYDLGDDG